MYVALNRDFLQCDMRTNISFPLGLCFSKLISVNKISFKKFLIKSIHMVKAQTKQTSKGGLFNLAQSKIHQNTQNTSKSLKHSCKQISRNKNLSMDI